MGERPQGGGTGTTGNGMVVICDLLDFCIHCTVESPNKGHFGTNINSSGLSTK